MEGHVTPAGTRVLDALGHDIEIGIGAPRGDRRGEGPGIRLILTNQGVASESEPRGMLSLSTNHSS